MEENLNPIKERKLDRQRLRSRVRALLVIILILTLCVSVFCGAEAHQPANLAAVYSVDSRGCDVLFQEHRGKISGRIVFDPEYSDRRAFHPGRRTKDLLPIDGMEFDPSQNFP